MLHPPLLGDAMGVGGQESKRIGRVAFVLRQMESDASHRIPDGMAAFQIHDGPAGSLGDCGTNVGVQLVPQPCQDCAVQILEALHWWRRFGQRGPLGFRRFWHADAGGILQIGIVAERGEQPLGQPAPENKARRQGFMQEAGGEHFQTMRGRDSESLGQARRGGLAEFRFSLLVRLDKQMSAGR